MTIYPIGDGYSCWRCGQWVMAGRVHYCPTFAPQYVPSWNPIITTTLTSEAGSLLLRITRDQAFFYVTDVIGTRYGHGETLKDALAEWESQVADLLGLDEGTIGDPILSEVRSYRKALGV